MRTAWLTCLILLCILAAAETKSSVGADAVWEAPVQFMADVHKACDGAPSFPECFAQRMAEQAPAAAVAFTRSIHNDGWMRHFRPAGRVEIAYVSYPFRANENQGWLFVNGSPAFVDPDDLKRLPKADVKSANPRAELFPGDRSGTAGPVAIVYPDGTQAFIVDYKVTEGCHACAILGRAFYVFDFNAKGKFASARYLGMVSAADELKWPLHVRSGQKFALALDGTGWTLEQPPVDSILRSGGERGQLWDFDVAGAGNTQMTFHKDSETLVLKVMATAALRRSLTNGQ